jgi:hypothetical protein
MTAAPVSEHCRNDLVPAVLFRRSGHITGLGMPVLMARLSERLT